MENKFKTEMDEHKQKLDKEYEALMLNFQRELEKLRGKHNTELDKKVSESPHPLHVLEFWVARYKFVLAQLSHIIFVLMKSISYFRNVWQRVVRRENREKFSRHTKRN